jgi:hypothetical protein
MSHALFFHERAMDAASNRSRANALSESDPSTGRVTNATFGDYLIPVNADAPDIDVVLLLIVRLGDPPYDPPGRLTKEQPNHLRFLGPNRF